MRWGLVHYGMRWGLVHYGMSSSCSDSAAEAAAKHKEDKYADISHTTILFRSLLRPFASINQVGTDFISSLGQRLALITDNLRKSSFLFQRLSIEVNQRVNGVCFSNSLDNLQDPFFYHPRRTYKSINLIYFQ
jgi:hypothetical protein